MSHKEVKYLVVISGAMQHFGWIWNHDRIAKNSRMSILPEPNTWHTTNFFTYPIQPSINMHHYDYKKSGYLQIICKH